MNVLHKNNKRASIINFADDSKICWCRAKSTIDIILSHDSLKQSNVRKISVKVFPKNTMIKTTGVK